MLHFYFFNMIIFIRISKESILSRVSISKKSILEIVKLYDDVDESLDFVERTLFR